MLDRYRRLTRVGFFVLASALAGCGYASVPTPVGPLDVTPAALTFIGIGQVQHLAITDPNYSGSYTATGCGGVATIALAGATITVTSVTAGACAIHVSDSAGNSADGAVGVTAVDVPIQ
jgi:hypothetical protein